MFRLVRKLIGMAILTHTQPVYYLYVQHITLMYFMYVSNISDDDDDEVIIVAIATSLVLSQFQGCG